MWMGVFTTQIQRNTLFLLFSLGFFWCVGVPLVHAQFSLGSTVGNAETVLLTLNPQYPGPLTPVEISLDDYAVNAVGARISWFVDGVERTEDANRRSISLTTGSVGKKLAVKVVLTRANGSTLTTIKTIVPAAVDVILEANTYVPTFYKGRPLPSAESTVRAVALVHDGSGSGLESYTYTWSLDAVVLDGGPIRGGYVREFTMPRYDNKMLSVQVINSRGEAVGKGSILLEAIDPELHFYEHSPLRGLSQKVIASPYPLLGEETTIYGEPYYLNATLENQYVTFDWKIDGRKTNTDVLTPNAISLRRSGDSGEARVETSIVTKSQIPQVLSGGFNLFFNRL